MEALSVHQTRPAFSRVVRSGSVSSASSPARPRGVCASPAPIEPLAALLSERPPQQLSATELRSRIALLEDAARAYRTELESRTARLDALPDEIQQVIFGQLCNALDPRAAVDYSSASKGLREPMQRVGEGASKSPLQQLKEENAAAAALGLKVGVQSCKALREAKRIKWHNRGLYAIDKGLSATDLATLGNLIPVLPALESCGSSKAQPARTACSWWRGWAWARCRP